MVESDDKETAVVTPAQPDIPAIEPVAAEEAPAVTEKEVVAPEPAETEILLAKTEDDDKKEEKTDTSTEKTNGDEIQPTEAVVEEVAEKKKKEKPIRKALSNIKLPAFITKSKDKYKVKAAADKEADGATDELLEKKEDVEDEEKPELTKEEEVKAEESTPAAPATGGFFANFKLKNPFAKKPVEAPVDVESPPVEESKTDEEKTEEAPPADGEVKPETEKTDEEKKSDEVADAVPVEQTQTKKSWIPTFKLPQLSSLVPKRFQKQNDDIEMGNGPNRAALASTETLEDSQKDQEKDTTDKPEEKTEANGNGAAVDEAKEKEKEVAENAENDKANKTFFARVSGYRCSIDDIAIIVGILLFVILVAVILVFTFWGGSKQSMVAPVRDGKFVEAVTGCGKVEGILDDGAVVFRGIPYARPPIEDLRFKPAELLDDIDYCWNDTLKAHNASAVCYQLYANGTTVGQEDCLTLDVVTPSVRYDNPVPVVVLIGAESLNGGAPGKLRPSTRFARAHDVIFVRPNFRLGVFGFLALNQLSKDSHPPSSGNYGLTDIVAALKWIQLNIAHFGGDPKSVTLFGHRAGGTLVTALTYSNKTNHLFARAWVSSGASIFPGKSLAESERANHQYEEALNCKDTECLRSKDEEKLLDAVPDTWRQVSPDLPVDENTTTKHEWLVQDGDLIKEDLAASWKNLDEKRPQIVFGATAHESHSEKLLLKNSNWTEAAIRKHIAASRIGAKGLTDQALERYGATYQGLVAMISDIRTICPLLVIARAQPTVPFYVVTQTGGELNIADVDADIQAILGRYEPHSPEQRRYVSAIQQMFYYYVAHGKVTIHQQNKRVIDIGQDALAKDDYPNCDFWIQNDIVPRHARLD